ncbi:hypothetical protein [uncultured Amnibacterium sp.]
MTTADRHHHPEGTPTEDAVEHDFSIPEDADFNAGEESEAGGE